MDTHMILKGGSHELLDQVAQILDACGKRYEVKRTSDCSDRWYDFELETDSVSEMTVRIKTTNERIRVHSWISIEPGAVRRNQVRLLKACNVVSTAFCLNARVEPEGIDIRYEIPEGSSAYVEMILPKVLDYFEAHDSDVLGMIIKAIHTKEKIDPYAFL